MSEKSVAWTSQEQFNLKQAEWRGYTLKALEDMANETVELKKKIEEIDRKVTNLQLKVATVGSTVALAVSILIKLLGY